MINHATIEQINKTSRKFRLCSHISEDKSRNTITDINSRFGEYFSNAAVNLPSVLHRVHRVHRVMLSQRPQTILQTPPDRDDRWIRK